MRELIRQKIALYVELNQDGTCLTDGQLPDARLANNGLLGTVVNPGCNTQQWRSSSTQSKYRKWLG